MLQTAEYVKKIFYYYRRRFSEFLCVLYLNARFLSPLNLFYIYNFELILMSCTHLSYTVLKGENSLLRRLRIVILSFSYFMWDKFCVAALFLSFLFCHFFSKNDRYLHVYTRVCMCVYVCVCALVCYRTYVCMMLQYAVIVAVMIFNLYICGKLYVFISSPSVWNANNIIFPLPFRKMVTCGFKYRIWQI